MSTKKGSKWIPAALQQDEERGAVYCMDCKGGTRKIKGYRCRRCNGTGRAKVGSTKR